MQNALRKILLLEEIQGYTAPTKKPKASQKKEKNK
jgi:hypothetical protein